MEMCSAPWAYSELVAKLKTAGLRPTRQRVILAHILFGQGDRHVTAEQLHREVSAAHLRISLATVYNSLNQFTDCGLVKQIAGAGDQTFFDTNISDHFHFVHPTKKTLMDIPEQSLQFSTLPTPPEGMEIDRIEVTVHLKKKQ